MACTCDHCSPPERVLRSPEFCGDLAKFYTKLGLSGDATIYWVLAEIYDHRTGVLIDLANKPIPVETRTGAAAMDNMWGEDEKRFINRFKEKASKPLRHRLQQRCAFPVLMMEFARRIHRCRTEGLCN